MNANFVHDPSRGFWIRAAILAWLWLSLPLREIWSAARGLFFWLFKDRCFGVVRIALCLLMPLFFWLAPLGVWYIDHMARRSAAKEQQ